MMTDPVLWPKPVYTNRFKCRCDYYTLEFVSLSINQDHQSKSSSQFLGYTTKKRIKVKYSHIPKGTKGTSTNLQHFIWSVSYQRACLSEMTDGFHYSKLLAMGIGHENVRRVYGRAIQCWPCCMTATPDVSVTNHLYIHPSE